MIFGVNKELDMGNEKYMIYIVVSLSLLLLHVVWIIFDSRYAASFCKYIYCNIHCKYICSNKIYKTPQFIDNFDVRFGMKLIAIVITIARIFFRLIYFMFVDY